MTEPSELTKAPRVPAKGIDKSKYVWIVLNEDVDNMPPTGLPVGVNGRCFIIQPGKPVAVPPEVLEVLDHAIVHVPHKDPNSLRITGYHSRLRFPYQRVPAPRNELEAA